MAHVGTQSAVRVLIVDDQSVFRDAARAVVEATEGFASAGEAASGERALAQLGDVDPHLVLMDVCMPGMGGIEAARVLTETSPDVVVVLLSAKVSHEVGGHNGQAPVVLDKRLLSPALLRTAWDRARPVEAFRGEPEKP
jgi:CheY-like chemotaxis protein